MRGDARYLAQDESIVLRVRRHLIVLFGPFVQAVAAVVLAVVIGVVASPAEGSDLVDLAAGLVAAFFVVRFAWKLWQWRADRIVVTDRRIFEVSGVLTRKVASMPLEKMTDITYRRSILGRLFGFGELIVETAGQDQSLHRIGHLPRPDDFYRTITWLVTGGLMPRSDPESALDLYEDEYEDDEEDTGPLPRVIV
ncbi:MAG TPA: PH domain-containing protein [Actinomycetota bacterium]|nr:PH domain-containing protein [Actinomycetota bacterium]